MFSTGSTSPLRHNILQHWVSAEKAPLILIATHLAHRGEQLQTCMQGCDYTTIVAEDGKEAFAQALRYRPNLILVEAKLPVLNGLQLTDCLRKNPTTRTIPIIALTNGLAPFADQQFLDVGANSTLQQPIQLNLLAQTVTRLLQFA